MGCESEDGGRVRMGLRREGEEGGKVRMVGG